MKNILIIGIGHFGSYLTKELAKLGNQIMLVDKSEKNMEDLLPDVAGAKIGDCSDIKVLKSLGVQDFDLCFVCVGHDFKSSLEITSQLKELGAKRVISKANEKLHAKFLLRNGADEIIYPDRDISEKVAVAYSSDQVFDYIELADNYGIYEILPERKWEGHSLKEVDVRNKYGMNVIAVKKGDKMEVNPGADYIFKAEEHLLVIGNKDVVAKLVKKY